MKLPYMLWLFGATSVFLGAATASRAYIGTTNLLYLLLSMALYIVGNLMMLKLMREGGLGIAVSLSAISQLLLINVIAFLFFGERLNTTQLAGVGLGIVAMGLMLLPSPARS
jgi:small multidrug resistance pump